MVFTGRQQDAVKERRPSGAVLLGLKWVCDRDPHLPSCHPSPFPPQVSRVVADALIGVTTANQCKWGAPLTTGVMLQHTYREPTAAVGVSMWGAPELNGGWTEATHASCVSSCLASQGPIKGG